MRARELYDELLSVASGVYDAREARAAVTFLMERRFGGERLALACDPGRDVAAYGLDDVTADIVAGRPVQYIAGGAWFDGMWLTVHEGVLIPRPETEELVRRVAEDTPATVLDVGTGSGAIAIALARRGMRVTAVDVSEDALAVARENARLAGVDVAFDRCDILSEIPVGDFDAVVSNPPYIPLRDLPSMHRNVAAHEPHGALFVPDDDPLIFYRAIARMGVNRVYFEIYEHFPREVCELLSREGYSGIEVRDDLNGRPRIVAAAR